MMRVWKAAEPKFLLGVLDGGVLERRVMRLLDSRVLWARRWRMASAGACVAVMAAVCVGAAEVGVSPVTAQGAEGTEKMAFEVASIKPNKDVSGDSRSTFSRNEYQATNKTLMDIIRSAYGMTAGGKERVSGGPGWIDSSRFDIRAKLSESDAAELQKLDRDQQQARMKLLLQTLLADRFKLKVHHETRELPVFVLTVAKSGAKLMPSSPSDSQGQHGVRAGRGQISGMDTKFDTFVNVLGMQPEVGRLILDKTGLTGSYDFTLKWTPEAMTGGNSTMPPESSGPSLFTAIQEQLGLKLESTKGPVDVIVIDSVEMPSEN